MTSLLYIVTGLALAAQTFWFLAWAMWGAPTNVWEYLALLGSLMLFVSGIMNAFKSSVVVYVAMVSAALIWSFYLPATIVTIRETLDSRNSSIFAPGTVLPFLIVYGLLVSSTAIATRNLISVQRARRVN